jgi:hypothetical protein
MFILYNTRIDHQGATPMGIIYDDNPAPYSGPPVDYYKLNANRHYLTHYSNKLTLTFMEQAERNARTKIQISKELRTADRKCAYWMRHPNFNMDLITAEIAKLHKMWNMGDGAVLRAPANG